MEKIRFSFVPTNFYTRWPCHVCGGWTEKDGVLCEVTEGPYTGLRVCAQCLKAGQGKVDERLTAHIERLEEYAAQTRSLIGRLELPTFSAWEAAERANDEAQRANDEAHGCEHSGGTSATVPIRDG